MASRRIRSSPRGLKQARGTHVDPLLFLAVHPATAWGGLVSGSGSWKETQNKAMMVLR
jgi:hypothetical protein